MSVIKCKMCGAPLDVTTGEQLVTCFACEVTQTVPNANDELKLQMFERAYESRYNCDFSGAYSTFQGIATLFPDEAEAYWGLCLCTYGVEYVDDPATRKKKPTCHRTLLKSILTDHNYQKACELSGAAKWKYEEEAKEIDEIQKKIHSLACAEKPYDIFICYKETDDATGVRTADSLTAQEIYTALVENGYRVFFARNTLKGKAGSEYEPYIYAALSTAKIMLVIGSKPEYFNAVWVKNEWSRFMSIGESGKKIIIPCYENMDAYSLPSELKNYQGLDMKSTLFSADLIKNVQRLIPKEDEKTASVAAASDNAATRKELDMKDGVYVGEAIASRPHGYGTYMYNNGARYEGYWKMGERHGQGTFTYANGDKWSGEWSKNQGLNGSGIYHDVYNKENRCRIGTLRNGLLQGEGEMKVNGKPYAKGTFKDGVLNGEGEYFINGYPCKGEFRNGKPWNALGYFRAPGTDYYYTGKWENGQPNGKGSYAVRAGRIFGTFVNGLNGEVEWKLSDTERYVGTVVNGKISKGIYYFGEDRYEGEFLNSKYHGKGTYFYPNGSWSGEWKDGSRWTGKGLIILYENGKKNGNAYNGEMVNGKYHGNGTFFYPEGKWTGIWKEGKRVNGQGLIYHYDDNGKRKNQYYNGRLENGVASGMGVFVKEDGSRWEGEFRNDRIFNGRIYNARNMIVDTYVNGKSQNEKRQENTKMALDILSLLK